MLASSWNRRWFSIESRPGADGTEELFLCYYTSNAKAELPTNANALIPLRSVEVGQVLVEERGGSHRCTNRKFVGLVAVPQHPPAPRGLILGTCDPRALNPAAK